MSERISAERACKEPNPIIDGRKANVNLAILGAKPRGNAVAAGKFSFSALCVGIWHLAGSDFTFFPCRTLSEHFSILDLRLECAFCRGLRLERPRIWSLEF